MKQKVLVDMERQRQPNSGLGHYCRCLEQGLRETENTLELYYYRPKEEGKEEKDVRDFYDFHKFFNHSTYGIKLLHISCQEQKNFLRHLAVKKKIVTLHELNFLHEDLREEQRQERLKLINKNLNSADVIVCISDFVKQDLLKNQHLFKLKKGVQIRLIHNGLIFDDTEIPENYKPFSQLHEQDFLLSIGVLHHKKQQLRMVEMMPYLPETMKLVLVYSEEKESYSNQIIDAVARLGLSRRVILLPNISNKEKRYLLNNMKALVHPSIAEGFSIPPVEAMAVGKPIFLSQATSLPEIGGEEAFYFKQGDKKEALAETIIAGLKTYEEDKEKAQRLKAWAMQYDYRIMAKKYLKLYEEVLSQ